MLSWVDGLGEGPIGLMWERGGGEGGLGSGLLGGGGGVPGRPSA